MYPLPHDTDLSFLVGSELLQVCVGLNEVILNFDRDVRITMLTHFAVETLPSGLVRYENSITGGPALLFLLHEQIVAASATDEGDLIVTFRTGARLLVYDTSNQFESFYVAKGDVQIIA